MAVEFKDVTSHSQGAKDRTPRTWEAKISGIRLTVTRHNYYAKDEWIARAHPAILEMELLHSKGIDEAKAEAVELLASRCSAISRACK